MRKFIMTIAAMSLALPSQADDAQYIDLDAGLWEYAIVLEVDGMGVVARETNQFCLSEAESNLTVNDLLNEMSDGECTSSGEVLLVGSASADMACVYPEDNMRAQGRLEGSFTATTYDFYTAMTFTGPGGTSQSRFTGKARRLGGC